MGRDANDFCHPLCVFLPETGPRCQCEMAPAPGWVGVCVSVNSGNASGDGGNVWDERETTGCVCLLLTEQPA